MGNVQFYGGKILFAPSGKIAMDPACCCSCDCRYLFEDYPPCLYLHVSGVTDGYCSNCSQLNGDFAVPYYQHGINALGQCYLKYYEWDDGSVLYPCDFPFDSGCSDLVQQTGQRWWNVITLTVASGRPCQYWIYLERSIGAVSDWGYYVNLWNGGVLLPEPVDVNNLSLSFSGPSVVGVGGHCHGNGHVNYNHCTGNATIGVTSA